MLNILDFNTFSIGPYLKPIIVKTEQSKPHCSDSALPLPANLDNIFSSVLKERFVNSPDDQLSEWLQMMAGAHYASVNELGTKIGIALQEVKKIPVRWEVIMHCYFKLLGRLIKKKILPVALPRFVHNLFSSVFTLRFCLSESIRKHDALYSPYTKDRSIHFF